MSEAYSIDKDMRVGDIEPGINVVVQATITSLRSHRIKNGSIMTDAEIGDSTGSVKCVWFSTNELTDLKVGSEYKFEGQLENKYGRLALQKPKYELTRADQHEYEPARPEPIVKQYATHKKNSIDFGNVFGGIVSAAIVLIFAFAIISWVSTSINNRHLRQASGVSCKDVTSFDYNWNNDVRCIDSDGTTFYTNYAGADKYGYNFH